MKRKFKCVDVAVIPGERRCMHFISSKKGLGACMLDSRLMCEEFIRANHGEELARRFALPLEEDSNVKG